MDELLARLTGDVQCEAWVFLPNHYHIALETPDLSSAKYSERDIAKLQLRSMDYRAKRGISPGHSHPNTNPAASLPNASDDFAPSPFPPVATNTRSDT